VVIRATHLSLTSAICLLALQSASFAAPKPPSPEALQQALRQSATALLRQPGGEQLGSAVIVAKAKAGYWLATNRHVVRGLSDVCVVTSDRKASTARVLGASANSRTPDLDLAFVWLPANDQQLIVAAPKTFDPKADPIPLVIATGYPVSDLPSQDGPSYIEKEGLLLPLLDRPIQGGFQLAYTGSITPGMSGGGIFQDGALIGINGAHSDPLWAGNWSYLNGQPVPNDLDQKLDLLSLGIPVDAITRQLDRLVPPTDLSKLKPNDWCTPKAQAITGVQK
jgi:S1-C subfamily serine protease